jgi:Glycosyltransferase family 87
MPLEPQKSLWKEYAALLGFIAALSILLGLLVPVTQASKRDFVFYWMAGHLLVHGSDPYSEQPLPSAQVSNAHTEKAIILYNAPNALWLLVPLGFMSERAANIFWIFIVVATVVVSIRLIPVLNREQADRGLHIAAYGFAPVLLCITAGQMSCFLLLAMMLFLLLHKQQPFWAGIALSICMVKPHVLVPFGIAVGLWIIHDRKYLTALGFVLGCAVSSAVPIAFRPSIWRDYFSMMLGKHIEQQFWPTPSMLFRILIHPSSIWLQSVPVVVAAGWATWYYLRHRRNWTWTGPEGYLLCLVSLFVAPRAWVTDEVLALPALAFLLYSGILDGFPQWVLGAAMLVALIETFAGVSITSAGYVWTTAAWLTCYLLATHLERRDAFEPATQVPI